MLLAQNIETINSTWKVAVSFKIIMTTSVTRPCFTTQHQTCKTKTKTDFFCSQTGLVVRPTVSATSVVNWSSRLYVISSLRRFHSFQLFLEHSPSNFRVGCTCPSFKSIEMSNQNTVFFIERHVYKRSKLRIELNWAWGLMENYKYVIQPGLSENAVPRIMNKQASLVQVSSSYSRSKSEHFGTQVNP